MSLRRAVAPSGKTPPRSSKALLTSAFDSIARAQEQIERSHKIMARSHEIIARIRRSLAKAYHIKQVLARPQERRSANDQMLQ
ncbi:MAG TPA: hypothetical protein VKQ89_05705 [Candidatus Angelobacter sp.]|nr:hypothetical protein [Candidatus Angelobacter sp.]